MAPEILGEGVLLVSVKQDVDREMKEAEAAFERARRRMDRKRATMTLDADLAPLQKKVDQAERKVEEYKKRVQEDANLGLDTKKAERNLKEWERKLHERRSARDEINLDTEKARKQLAALQQLEDDRKEAALKHQRAIQKGEERLAKARVEQSRRAAREIKAAEDRAERDRLAAWKKRLADGKKALAAEVKLEQDAMRKSIAAKQKEAAAKIKAEAKVRREAERAAAKRAKDLQADHDNMSGLLKDYAQLQRRIDSLRRNRKTFTGFALPSRRASLDLDIRAAEDKAKQLAERLEDVGVDKKRIIDIEVRERNTGAIHRLVSGLSDASVRLGPFTASVGGALRALTLLAPVIVSVVGALGALVGVMGSGLLGGIGVLGTGFAGLVPLIAGTVFAIKPLISDFLLATKAQEALHKAILKYGEGSKEAKKAQEQLNQTLKGLDPVTRRAVQSFDRVKNKWKEVTGSVARQQFGKVVGAATRAAEANVQQFGERTNVTMGIVGDAIAKAMRGLSKAGARSNINAFFTNINNMLPDLFEGIGNLAVAFGRLMKSFSRGSVLGSLVKDFKDWTEGVRNSAEDTDKLNGKVDKMRDAFKSTVGFVSALTGFLAAFFGAGVGPGIGLLDDMTGGLNRMKASMQGVGRAKLVEFFQNSADTAQQFYETLKPFAQLFMEWATIMRPVATNLLAIIEPLATFTRNIMRMKAVRGIIVGIFTALLARRAIGGIRNLAGEVKLLGRNLAGLKVPGAISRFFGGKGKTPKVGTGTTSTTGSTASRTTVVPGAGGVHHEPAVQSVRIVGSIPLEVIPVGGGGVSGGGKGGKGGGPTILPGGGPDPKEVPKTRGRFAKFFEKVFGGLKKLPGAEKVGKLLTGAALLGRGPVAKILGPFKTVFGKVFGTLGGFLRPMLGRVLGRGVFAGIGKLISKAVPVLGWGWLIHDLLPDSPRQAIDKVLGAGLRGIGSAFKSNFEAAMRTAGDIWGGLKSGATTAFDFVKRKATDGFSTISRLASKPINFSLGLRDKVKSGASSAIGFLGRQAAKGFKISLGLKDNVRSAAAKTVSWLTGIARKGAKFSLGLKNTLSGVARAAMSGIASIARRGAKFALGLLDKLKGPASRVMSAIAGTARRGARFALGLLDKASHAAAVVFDKIRAGAAAGATFTIHVVADVAGSAAKFVGKGLHALNSLRPGHAQGAALGFNNSSLMSAAQGSNKGDTSLGERAKNRHRADKLANALELGTRSLPRPAAQTPVGRVSGQTVSKPTYLVGEENRREYVVSTNPAYKGRNKKIVAMAARDLGMNITSAAQGYGSFDPFPGYYANATVANMSGQKAFGFSSKRTKKQKRAAKKRLKKGLSPAALNNPWGRHIKGLLDQQSDWEREASIRENAVHEPEDFINETKNPDGTTTYALDQTAIDTYKAQVQQVAEAYKVLTQITAEIVQSIPKAIQSMKAEIVGHNYNIGQLTHEIDREEKRLRSKTSTSAQKETARARLKKLRPALSQEKRLKEIAVGLRDEFSGETRKEAGFDYREFTATYSGLLAELGDGEGSIKAAADAQLASTADTGGSGAGGGGDAPLSYGAQQLISDTEKMNLLREYGGNAYTTSPGGSSATSPGGGSYIANPAGISDPARSSSGIAGSTAVADTSGGSTLRSMATSSGTGSSFATGDTAAASGGTTATAAPSKTITITNNYTTAPEDPHLWTQGMAFEINTAI